MRSLLRLHSFQVILSHRGSNSVDRDLVPELSFFLCTAVTTYRQSMCNLFHSQPFHHLAPRHHPKHWEDTGGISETRSEDRDIRYSWKKLELFLLSNLYVILFSSFSCCDQMIPFYYVWRNKNNPLSITSVWVFHTKHSCSLLAKVPSIGSHRMDMAQVWEVQQ
jgi:hypothetical protein